MAKILSEGTTIFSTVHNPKIKVNLVLLNDRYLALLLKFRKRDKGINDIQIY